jgi:hypothetical protein
MFILSSAIGLLVELLRRNRADLDPSHAHIGSNSDAVDAIETRKHLVAGDRP